MTIRGPEQLEIPVSVLTESFQIRGKLAVLGTFLTYINDETKPTLTILNPVVIGISTANPAAQMEQKEVLVLKRSIHALCIEGGMPKDVTLPPRVEMLMAYSGQYAIAGEWHLTPDVRLQDFVDAALSPFLPVTNARIYPLVTARQGIIPSAPFVLVYRTTIQTYHKG